MAQPPTPPSVLPTTPPAPAGHPRRWWILGVLCLSLVLVVMGNSVLNVAIPTLVRELDATGTQLQWIVDAYALVFGALLLMMGAVGDRFGRRGALYVGLSLFGVSSLASVFATEPAHLVATRAIMGLGGAIVMPATLSILTTAFPPHERGKAIGIWAAFAGIGGALGPLIGGWLLMDFAWQSIFFINLPVVALALVGVALVVPTSKDPTGARLDLVGSLLSIVALGSLLYGIIEGPEQGWTGTRTLVAFGLSALAWPAFILWELRSTRPMLPMAYFRDRGFTTGNLAIGLAAFVMFAFFFVMTQYLQFVQGHTPFQAGLRTLPLAVGIIGAAPQSDRLSRLVGTPWTVALGLLLVAGTFFSLTFFDAGTPYWPLALCFVALGAGMGFAMAPSTTLIMDAVPHEKAGVGSAMNDTSREVAGALGIAVLGSILNGVYRSSVELPDGLPPAAAETARDSIGLALVVAGSIGGETGAALAGAARAAFLDAMHMAYLVGAAATVVAAVLVAALMPRRAARHTDAPGADEGRGPDGVGAGRAPAGRAPPRPLLETPVVRIRSRRAPAAPGPAVVAGAGAAAAPSVPAASAPAADDALDPLARLHARVDRLYAQRSTRAPDGPRRRT